MTFFWQLNLSPNQWQHERSALHSQSLGLIREDAGSDAWPKGKTGAANSFYFGSSAFKFTPLKRYLQIKYSLSIAICIAFLNLPNSH